MSATPFLQKNQDFSDRAHAAAKMQIYPILFAPVFGHKMHPMHIQSTTLSMGAKEAVLDGQLAVDRIVSIQSYAFRNKNRYTIQERFRKPEYASREDLTITEWNNATGQPSEFYKLINTNLFVYGYFDEITASFLSWIACWTSPMMHGIETGAIRFTTGANPRSRQEFIAIPFSELRKHGVVHREFIRNAKEAA